MKISHSLLLISALTLSCFTTLGCAVSTSEEEAAVREEQEALGSSEVANAGDAVEAAATECKRLTAGFFKHPTLGGVCYYIEVKQKCGKTIYAYERDLVTNKLETAWDQVYAYACHPAVIGHTYRGQYAFGALASDKVTFTGTAASFAALKVLPRT